MRNYLKSFGNRLINLSNTQVTVYTVALIIVGTLLAYTVGTRTIAFVRHYRENSVLLKNLLAKEKEKSAISKTLQIAYNISPYSADGYSEVFYATSKLFKIDWEYFGALVYIESQYNQFAKSPKGACGLTQLLEPTAAWQASKLHIAYKPNFTIWNSFINLWLGCGYLASGYKDGNYDNMIRHYNPCACDDEYLEPFKREYIKLSYIFMAATEQ